MPRAKGTKRVRNPRQERDRSDESRCPYCEENRSGRVHRIRCEMGLLRGKLLSQRTMREVEHIWAKALRDAHIEQDETWELLTKATDDQIEKVRAALAPQVFEPDPLKDAEAWERLRKEVFDGGRAYVGPWRPEGSG